MASFQRQWLEGHEHELPKMIVQARNLTKLELRLSKR